MSQKLFPSATQLLLLLQFILVTIANAYPYVLVPQQSPSYSSQPRHLVKRAFDRFDNSGVFSFGAKRYDRFEDFEPYESRRVFKRAFDRMDYGDFGLRRKRSFDRMGGTEFGLMKRSSSPVERDQLIDELTESIMALRNARSAEPQKPVVITYDSDKK